MLSKQVIKFIEKYDLSKEENIDVWKCHNNYILKHDACIKIATMEKIKLSRVESLYQDAKSCRLLVTMVEEDEEGNVVNSITSIGEADSANSKNNYYGCMAEKRGMDRCILKLVNAYEWGIYSDVEADDFKDLASDKQIRFLMEQCVKFGFDNSSWDFKGLTKNQAKKYFDELELFKNKQGEKSEN